MLEVRVEHLGDSQFEIRARGHKLISDQPIEAGGYDEGMTDTPALYQDRICLIFVCQVAGVGQAGENILSGQAWIVDQDFALGLACGEKIENELDSQTCPADHWLANQDLGIHDDAFRKRHDYILPCRRTSWFV